MKLINLRRIRSRTGDMQNLMNVTLMMVILAFFIVLNSIAVPAETKKKKALGSLTGTLGLLEGGLRPSISDQRNRSLIPGPMLSRKINNAQMLSRFEEYLLKKEAAKKVSAFMKKGSVELSIESSLLFSPGSAAITPQGDELVKELATFLAQIKGKLLVEGHTSDRLARSVRYPTLTDLSTARAGAVVRSMFKHGWSSTREIAIAGYGDLKPKVINDSEKNRDKNERITISYKLIL